MTSVSVHWVTMHDGHVCPKCEELGQYMGWIWYSNDHVPMMLEHPSQGVVYDDFVGSLAHVHSGPQASCRCHIEVKVDLSDLTERVAQLYEVVKEKQTVLTGQPTLVGPDTENLGETPP